MTLVKNIGPRLRRLIVGWAFNKNTNTKVKRPAVIRCAPMPIVKAVPFFIDRGVHPRLHDLAASESPVHYVQRMRAMEATVREPLAALRAEPESEAQCWPG